MINEGHGSIVHGCKKKKKNRTNHMSPDNRLNNKLQYIHSIEYNTGMKMNQIQPSTLSKMRLGAKY